jgi:predicted transcriptional regulator
MSVTLSVRLDEETERELAELASESSSRHAAVVNAIHEAYRHLVLERIHRGSTDLDNDPDDRAEVEAARQELGGGGAW